MIGTTVSHYTILEKLGAGGMGEVYKAEDTRLKRTVALKFLPPHLTSDLEAKQRLIHEAQAASSLQHSNICVVHDIDETTDGRMFLVMEFLEGEPLNKIIDRGLMKLEDALSVAIQVAQGLAKAHEHGIIHRDIKPGNIILTNDGIAKVVDFGLARLSGRTMITRTGTSLGTLAYMSPEQTRGEPADQRSDIWALGVVLYEMIVGKMPFTGEYENVVVYEIANVEPQPVTSLRTGVPMDLERVIHKAMAKLPAERYQHADEMLVDLKRLTKSTEEIPQGTRLQPPVVSLRKRHWKPVLLYSVLLLVLLSSFFILKPLLFDDILVSEPKPVAVVAFVNQTGDLAYDYLREAIPNLLITSLEQSKYLRVMTWERMNDLLRQMGKADVKLIDKDLGFELCQREGVHAIVIGTFVKAGETFATDVKVLDVDTKELLKTASARGDGVQSILTSQIDQLSKEIARGVGLSQRRVDSSPTHIAEVTTSSMDAYNFFLRGRSDFEKLYFPEARASLERAITLDSTFALALVYLSKIYGNLIMLPEAELAIRKAKVLSARAPEKERLLIEARYADLIERDLPKSLAFLEELVRKYPQEKRFRHELGTAYVSRGGMRDKAQLELEKAIELDPTYAAPTNQLAYLYKDQGLYEKAIQTLQRYAALSPGDANPYDSMAEILLCMGRMDESLLKYREALRMQPTFYGTYRGLAYVSALKEDFEGALGWIDSLMRISPTLGLKMESSVRKAMYLSVAGRTREAEILLASAESKIKDPLLGSPIHWIKGVAALQQGDSSEARKELTLFHEIYTKINPLTPIINSALENLVQTLVYLKEGKTGPARNGIDALKGALGSLEALKGTLATITGILEAELFLDEGQPEKAIAIYRATPVAGPTMSVGWRSGLYNFPVFRDVVPRAFEKMGNPDSAIAEYERLLRIDTTSIDRRLIHPLYHYRLAALCQKVGKLEKAATEYRRFLDIWKNADNDRPELRDARKQLALVLQKKSTTGTF